MRLKLLILVLALSSGLASQAAVAKDYDLPEYGLTVAVPDRLKMCWPEPDKRRRAMLILINPANFDNCDGKRGDSRSVNIGAFPWLRDYRTLRHFALDFCYHERGDTCTLLKPGLAISGHKSISLRAGYHNGWDDVVVFSRVPALHPGSDNEGVVFIVRLLTRHRQVGRDLPVFREVLRTVRLRPTDGPYYG